MKKYIFFPTKNLLSNLTFQKTIRLNGVVEIRDKQELLLSSDADVFRQELSVVLSCMREELDDHRLAVNENTDELAATTGF